MNNNHHGHFQFQGSLQNLVGIKFLKPDKTLESITGTSEFYLTFFLNNSEFLYIVQHYQYLVPLHILHIYHSHSHIPHNLSSPFNIPHFGLFGTLVNICHTFVVIHPRFSNYPHLCLSSFHLVLVWGHPDKQHIYVAKCDRGNTLRESG